MSWAKRNLYFLISGIVAVVLLIAAGWYCYAEMQSNNANWDQLNQAYQQLIQIANKNPGARNGSVDNVTAAREQTVEVKKRVGDMEKLFLPVRGIPNTTNRLEDRVLASAVRDTITQLRTAAVQHNVTLPLGSDFAFSFSYQAGKTVYDPNSWDQLSKQLGEIKTICDTLYSCRVIALDAVQRERTADDSAAAGAGATADYLDSTSVTSGNVVVTPYQVTFQCFTPELGNVLSSFANQSHTIVVKTLDIQPAELGYANEMPMMQMQPNGMPGAQPLANPRGGLPVVIDEKKLKVIMQVDFVKILPAQGR
jgi:hypothetical protein